MDELDLDPGYDELTEADIVTSVVAGAEEAMEIPIVK